MKLAALKELLARATPRPWHSIVRGSTPLAHVVAVAGGKPVCDIYGGIDTTQAEREGNARCITALCNAAPALIACAEAIHEYLEWGAMTGSDRELFRVKFENCLRMLEDA